MYGNRARSAGYLQRLRGFLQSEYGLEIIGITPAQRGYYGETWRLDTPHDAYFAKLSYCAAHKSRYTGSFGVMEHLRLHGIDFISEAVKLKNGRLYGEFDGAVLGVFKWIDGENVQNEITKAAEYKMLGRIYAVPAGSLEIPRERLDLSFADLFFSYRGRLREEGKNEAFKKALSVLDAKEKLLEGRRERLELFASRCRGNEEHFYITHGDAGGNIIVSGDNFFMVDWDDPRLAPPERDAWFCLYRPWAMDAFNKSLADNGIKYALRPERLAYYCYNSFFYYLTEYMQALFDTAPSNMHEKLAEYFGCWIEEEIAFADKLP